QAYNKYLIANTKANDLTRQQQSKQVSWLMNKPKKQFLGCVAKHTPPEYKIVPYSGLRNSAYEKELNAGHTNRAAVLRPPPGMKIQHLPKGIREYVSRNPADFEDHLDEISAETKYLSTISRLVKKENGPDARNRIRRRILQAAENSGDVTDEDVDIENDLSASTKHCRLLKAQDTKCELNKESDNLKGLFENELASYNNKKQCMKINNKRYEERLQDLIEEKEKEYKAEMKRVQIECKNKTMSLEVWLEETQKELENKIEFIRKQMIVIRAFNDRFDQLHQTEKHHHCTSEKSFGALW
ncbi:Mature parasite-infected erythrocyte surface antigen (MESA) or PfEMP2, partial [Planoprotostelium fungivorum]